MSGFDGTGPAGYGAGTRRSRGPCGRDMAYGRGFGRGYGAGFYGNYPEPEPLSKDAQKQLIEAELKRIEAEKTEITKRLTSLE